MPSTWQLFTQDPDECRAFASEAEVLAMPSTPAGPPNRLRHVVRIEHQGRSYFLKTFEETQWKNRVHFRRTKPQALDDADRERRVTDALRAQGHGAPRPVAYGRNGTKSYYLCAELPGVAIAERMEHGQIEAGLAQAVARHCGKLLAEGFQLPDLSADHVFVAASTPAERPGPSNLHVLDLHNGGVTTAGRPAQKLLRRVLRRFARSVRNLPVDRTTAMRFATRLLRSAGSPMAQRRKLLTAAQPFGTAARYERGDRSRNYAARNPKRAALERQLLEQVWPGEAQETVLDLPCGTGRLLPFLRERGHRVAQVDGALAMLQQAIADDVRGELVLQANALQMPFADNSVDGVVMFRFLHHLPPEAAKAAIAEACRVARRFVVVSFFHPCSVHHLQRRMRQLLGTPATRFAMTLGTVQGTFAQNGFEPHRRAAQLAYARDLWLASFAAGGEPSSPATIETRSP